MGLSKKRPSSLNLTVAKTETLHDGSLQVSGDERTIKLSPASFPLSFGTVHFLDRPGVLAGRKLNDPGNWEVWGRHDSRMIAAIVPGPAPNTAVQIGRVNPGAIARMLAKIAHGYAISELGFDAFEWVVTPCIRLKEEAHMNWIGGSAEVAPPTPHLHTIRWRIERADRPLVVVDIRLFCFIGAPSYEIVVGPFRGKLDQLPFLEQPLRTIDIEQPPPVGEAIPAGREVIETGF